MTAAVIAPNKRKPPNHAAYCFHASQAARLLMTAQTITGATSVQPSRNSARTAYFMEAKYASEM